MAQVWQFVCRERLRSRQTCKDVNRQIVVAAFLCLFLMPAKAFGDTDQPVNHESSFVAVKVSSAPPLDASLTSPIWQAALKAPITENFTLRKPADHATVVYFLYDDRNLYIGVHASQEGVPIVASQTVDNAGVLTDDHITVLIDPTANGARVYQFRITPKAIRDESSSENARYAPDWTGVAKIFPNGDYNVMMVIPLSVLRSQGAPVQRWRMNFARFVAGLNDLYTWAYEPTATSPTSPQFWPVIENIRISSSAARPTAHADVYALASTGSDRDLFQTVYGSFARIKPRSLGVDFTYPLTNTMALVGTLNPDFSNIEQDQTTIAPQQFQRNLNEYRPFFAQGAQYINALPSVGVNGIADSLFYTPSIGIFNRGLKLEGTAGRSSVGILNVSGDGLNDTAFGYKYATPGQVLTYAAEGVFALRPGLRDATVGASVYYSNPHSGAFTILRDEGEQNSDTGSSRDFFVSEGLNTAQTFLAIDYRDVSPNFAPVDGYTSINDLKGPRLLYDYNGVGRKGGAIKSWTASATLDRYVDHSGVVREYDTNWGGGVTLNDQLSLSLYTGPSGVRFDPGPGGPVVPFNMTQFAVGYKDGSPTPLDFSYAWGNFADFFLQQIASSYTEKMGVYSLSLEFDGTVERRSLAAIDSQWLRRLSLTRSFGRDTSLAIGLRSISGRGGYSTPGTNLALSFNHRFANQDQLYLDYGAPAAPSTLHRFIMKYVFHTGGGTGT